jgi:hypothetical protein
MKSGETSREKHALLQISRFVMQAGHRYGALDRPLCGTVGRPMLLQGAI